MRQPPPFEPPRLRGLPPQDDPAGLARLVKSAIHAPKDPVPQLKRRIRSTLRRKSAWRRRYLRAAIVGGIIFVAGAVVGAVVQPIVRFRRLTKVASVENVYPSATGGRARSRRAPAPTARLPFQGLASEEQVDVTSAPAGSESIPSVTEMAGTPAPPAAPGPTPSPPDPAACTAATAPPRLPPPPTGRAPSPAPASRQASASVPASRTRAAPPVPSGGAELGRHVGAHPSFHQPFHQPVQTAMLEPPPQYAEPPAWPPSPSAGPQAAVAAPATYALAPPRDLRAPDRPTTGAAAPVLATAPPATATRAAVKVQPAAQPAPAAPSGEQALLFQAVRSLRSLRRPDQALGVLDEYVAHFPNGALLPEANRLRTEALLALGHAPAALAELNRGLGHKTGGGDENHLVRGELHAHAGRWHEALQDFDAVVRARLASGPAAGASPPAKAGDLLERALWGRASARSHLSDDLGARADLREYLRSFSDGRFASQARHLLGSPARE